MIQVRGSVLADRARPDNDLVQECLSGNENAWSALIDKYKRLIYSIPVNQGFSADEADDIFQAVCLDLLSELSRLRKVQALPAWLIRVTYHKCVRRRREQQRFLSSEALGSESASGAESTDVPLEMVKELEREQMLREALEALSPRCHRLVEMLFFDDPPRPYREVAESLGLATGSMGFIRGRCLERLRSELEKAGFERI